MTPTDYARMLMKSRGYVVVGFRYDSELIPEVVHSFGNGRLESCQLRITEKTDRKDWDSQLIAMFGNKQKNRSLQKLLPSTAFRRAVLEEKA